MFFTFIYRALFFALLLSVVCFLFVFCSFSDIFSTDFWATSHQFSHEVAPLRSTVLASRAPDTSLNYTRIFNRWRSSTNLQPTQNHSEIHHVYRISPTCSDFIPHYHIILKDVSTINPRKATGPDRISQIMWRIVHYQRSPTIT